VYLDSVQKNQQVIMNYPAASSGELNLTDFASYFK